METLYKNALCISITILCFSCNSVKKDILFDYTENWRKDSLGCKNLRNKKYSDSINDRIDFKNKNEMNLINYLGNYDKSTSNEKYKYLIYFFDTKCHNNAIIDSVDHCYLQYRINLKTSKVIDYQNICQ